MGHHGWSLPVASDIARNGLGLELLSETGAVAAEIFPCDADHSLSTTPWETSVPR